MSGQSYQAITIISIEIYDVKPLISLDKKLSTKRKNKETKSF